MSNVIRPDAWRHAPKTRDHAAFRDAMRRLPPPLPVFSDGVVCPWCGYAHQKGSQLSAQARWRKINRIIDE